MYNYHHIECYSKSRQDELLRNSEVYHQLFPEQVQSHTSYKRFAVLIGDTLILLGTKLKTRYETVNDTLNTPEPVQGY